MPDDPRERQKQVDAALKPVSEMLEEIRRKQMSPKASAPISRSKWNIQKEQPRAQQPNIDIFEQTAGSGYTEEHKNHFPVKDEISEYTIMESRASPKKSQGLPTPKREEIKDFQPVIEAQTEEPSDSQLVVANYKI